ncbi:MAG: DUF2064 domain-containing protein [Deltaproteobacteria bacterium]|nr:DUF2064 domain-containing protein [Deltaproteobacteria bacterium]
MNAGAIAIFVKTPGFSPIKSRLSKTIGEEKAKTFYLLSVSATEALVKKCAQNHNVIPYWSIAEKEGWNYWSHFQKIIQNEKTLGHRLSSVYNTLLNKHEFVFLIGADSPMINLDILDKALFYVKNSFVLGRALDGGFYLFGGQKKISEDVWCSIPYSDSTTAEKLYEKVSLLGSIDELPPLLDIDTYDDLKKMYLDYRDSQNLLPEQKNILAWIKKLL